ncbi:MAG TPA: LuxR C-terminal-related transcriptional regulator [Anaerolineae bacterium]|nr:LuxR C-terminal-related transcriptional regulator [Anaerolineae bacterium]
MLPFFLAVAYNVLILVFRYQIIRMLNKHPSLLLIDTLVSFILILGSGGFKSPYYLYSFSPLILGAFLFGYPGALYTASIQSALFIIAVYANGYRVIDVVRAGQHIVTDFLFFLLAGVSTAYLAGLLHELDAAKRRKAIIDFELEETNRCLEPRLRASKLSKREIQVLILSLEGKTIEQVAQELGISRSTVKTYLSRAYGKLNVSSKKEAISQVAVLESIIE